MTTIRIWWINNRLRAVSVAIWRDWFNPADGHSSTIVPVLWSIQLLICIRSPDAVRVILRFLHSNRISLEEAFVTRSEKSSGRRRQSAPICISTLSEIFKFLSKFWKIVFYYLSHDDWYERCGVGSLAPKLWIKTRRWRPQPQICILRLWRTWICISKKRTLLEAVGCWHLGWWISNRFKSKPFFRLFQYSAAGHWRHLHQSSLDIFRHFKSFHPVNRIQSAFNSIQFTHNAPGRNKLICTGLWLPDHWHRFA